MQKKKIYEEHKSIINYIWYCVNLFTPIIKNYNNKIITNINIFEKKIKIFFLKKNR